LNTNQKCLSIDQAPVITASGIGFLILVIQVALVKLSFYDHQISVSNPFAELSGFFSLVFHIIRSVILLFFVLVPNVYTY